MDQWINSFVNWVQGGVAALARYVAGALSYFWNTVAQALTNAAFHLGNLSNIFGSFRDAWERVMSAIYWKLRYIFLTLVPRALDQALTWAQQFAQWALSNAINFAISAVTTLRDWAIQAVNYTIGLINAMVQWAAAEIAQLRNLLLQVAHIVFGLLSSPVTLAEWLIGALWGVAWRYIYERRLIISQYLMRNAIGLTLFIAKTLEDIILAIL